jgi:hypothetical protein
VAHLDDEFSLLFERLFPEEDDVSFSARFSPDGAELRLRARCFASNPLNQCYWIAQKTLVVPLGTLIMDRVRLDEVNQNGVSIFLDFKEDPASPITRIPSNQVLAILYEIQLASAQSVPEQIAQVNQYLSALSPDGPSRMRDLLASLFSHPKGREMTLQDVIDPVWQKTLLDTIQQIEEAADRARAAAVSL